MVFLNKHREIKNLETITLLIYINTEKVEYT